MESVSAHCDSVWSHSSQFEECEVYFFAISRERFVKEQSVTAE